MDGWTDNDQGEGKTEKDNEMSMSVGVGGVTLVLQQPLDDRQITTKRCPSNCPVVISSWIHTRVEQQLVDSIKIASFNSFGK
jgi:hypothetical protein